MTDKKPPQDMLDWLGISNAPNWRGARPLGWFIGAVLTVALPLLFFASLAAAGATIWHTITLAVNGEQDGINLGAGALIAALLGAPFVIWGTVLKHQTVRYQKEGHITDRINKAVEQLGAEKTVDRIGRAVTFSSGNPEEMNLGEQLESETLIEWQGKPLKKEGWWRSEVGQWQVFSETEPNIEVRIGAILSLERIAQDSTRYDNGRDHVRVMEILCAYVRENAPESSAKTDNPRDIWQAALVEAREELASHAFSSENEQSFQESELAFKKCGINPLGSPLNEQVMKWVKDLPKPRADIQQALDILGRRDADQRQAEARWGKDAAPKDEWVFDAPCPRLPGEPSQSDLITFKAALESWKEEIHSYNGYRVDLRGANLQNADLSSAILSGARLERARLEGADLSDARLEGAKLNSARLEGANLLGARLEGVGLTFARLQAACLLGVRLERAVLAFARLEEADLRATKLEGAVLLGAQLQGAVLLSARWEGVNLEGARFDAATLWTDALLRGASVHSVDLTNTPISADQISQTFGDGRTKLPENIPRPAHWPKTCLDPVEFRAELEKYRADPAGYSPPTETEGQ